MSEKPIHVQVAEALGEKLEDHSGLKRVAKKGEYASFQCVNCRGRWGLEAAIPKECSNEYRSRYDLDWALTGPLLELYSFGLMRMSKASDPPAPGSNWLATTPDWETATRNASFKRLAFGPTPLLAICHLIIALSKEGKLK